jgi:superfamily II DNA or RNA helicase
LVLDEAHHYVAEQWSTIIDCYNGARTIGLTATPERQDGAPLGDVFQDIVVAANYSQLTRDGYLVPAIVFQPPSSLSRGDTAQDPIDAWLRYSGGARTFVFCQRVNGAVELAKRFREVGVSAEAVEANTPAMERDSIISRFRSGETRILTNVNILTEGIDIPEAACVVIGRQFGHVGNLLQAAGRVLRPSHGKSHAVIIDLTGATLKHGLPTDDREYSLSGRAIATIAYDRIDQGERFRLPGIVTGDELRMVAGQGFALNSDCIPEEIYLAAKRRDWDFMRLILRGIEGAGGCA